MIVKEQLSIVLSPEIDQPARDLGEDVLFKLRNSMYLILNVKVKHCLDTNSI